MPVLPQPARVPLTRPDRTGADPAAPPGGRLLASGRATDHNGRYAGRAPLVPRSVLDRARLFPGRTDPAMTALEERPTPGEGPVTPRVKDIALALACVFIDLFFSGYVVGDPAATHLGLTLPLWLFIGLVVVAYSALAWRRRAPWLVFLAVLGFCLLAGVVMVQFQPFTGVALALFTVARATPARQANPALVLAAFMCLANGQTASNLRGDSLTAMITTSSIFFTGTLVFWVIGRRERHHRLRQLEEQEQIVASAQDSLGQERQRIARDLHDILSHSMSAMILQSAGARAVSSSLDSTAQAKQVTEALAAIESTGVESMRELHRLLGLLRTADGDGDPGIARLRLADISPLVEATRHGGLVVQVHREGSARPLDPSVDLAAYHMVQESLTNAMKHAGRGAVVDLHETWEPGELQLQVRCGTGLPAAERAAAPPGSGTGLWGVNERVELAGGSFDAGPVDGGFVTTATFPLGGSPAGDTPPPQEPS